MVVSSSSSSSQANQTVEWIVLSSCAAIGLYYYFCRRRGKGKDIELDMYCCETTRSSCESCSIDQTAAIASGINRLKGVEDSDYALICDEGNVYEHQVAGHTDEILLSYKDMLFKPMIKEINFLKEVQFYECVSSLGAHSTQSPAVFLPKYYGVLNVRDQHRFDDLHLAADRERSGSETKTEQSSFDAQDVGLVTSPSFYIVLENVTAKFRKPCVLDLKIGRQTFEPTASEEKKKRNISKYVYQDKLGFRITGFKNYNCLTDEYFVEGKAFGRSLKPEQVTSGLEKFFQDGRSIRKDVIKIVLQKLEKIWRWASKQNTFHFYCSSVLVAYDGLKFEDNPQEYPEPAVDVRIIDFAHTICDENNTNDEGYVYGLHSVIKHLHEILSK